MRAMDAKVRSVLLNWRALSSYGRLCFVLIYFVFKIIIFMICTLGRQLLEIYWNMDETEGW